MMLTLFTIPKKFKGLTDVIQRNAIQSWMHLQPRPEIILFGDDERTAEVAKEFCMTHVPSISCNEYGTPLVNDVFEKAQRLATYDILCYVNTDIILFSDFMTALEQVVHHSRRFLLVGQRWDVEIKDHLDFKHQWEEELRTYVARSGQLHPPTGIDYFVFPSGLWGEIPPFAIGRTAWDNWLLYRARARGAILIDATQVVLAVHQNHDYAHITDGIEGAWKGPEAKRNQQLTGGYDRIFHLEDVNWLLTSQGLIPALTDVHRRRARQTWLLLHYPKLYAVQRTFLKITALLRRFALSSAHIIRRVLS